MIQHNKENQLEYPTELLDLLADEEKDLTNELISLRDELQRFTLNSAKAVERHEALIIKGVVIFTLLVFSPRYNHVDINSTDHEQPGTGDRENQLFC